MDIKTSKEYVIFSILILSLFSRSRKNRLSYNTNEGNITV